MVPPLLTHLCIRFTDVFRQFVPLLVGLLCSFIWIQDGVAQCTLAIIKQPVGATKCVGDTYSFTAANTGSATYQWQKDGVDLIDEAGNISGATTVKLTLTDLCATCDPGNYVLVATGTGSCLGQTAKSNTATLVVNAPATITNQPTNQQVCEGSVASFSVQASGTISSYQWYRNGTTITGATSATYQLTTSTANNDDKYKVAVTGLCGTVTSSEVTLGVQAKPAITLQPTGATKCVGDNYTFTATATNAGSYQWQHNGTDISGATGSSLVLTNLCSTCDAGSYRVRVDGAGACSAEQVVSNQATLMVNDPVGVTTQPVAQTVCEAASVSFVVSATGTITSYQWYRNGTAINGATSATYQLTTSTANNGDKYKVAVTGPCGTVTSSEVTLGVQAKPAITLQPTGATKCVGETYTFTATATNAGAYQWQKDGVDITGATSANLVLTSLQTTGAGTYRVRVTGAATCNGESLISNGAVLVVNPPVTINSQPTATAVCEGSAAVFSVQAAGSITGYQWSRNGTAITGATSATYQLTTSTANNGDKYKVDVQGPCGTLTSSEVTLTVNAKPVITLQPVGATKCVGDNYTFSVTATNAGAYQWQKDGADITGATAASLVLTNLCAICDAGSYVLKVSGAGACATQTVNSDAAVLIVNNPVTISAQPNAVTICEGASATFSVVAAGTITGYQWYRNGTAINGATSATYQLTTGIANNGDKYKVAVVGPCGTVISSEVTLGVQAKPAITLQPMGATKCVGDNSTFTTTATNAGAYQWQKDGADISGATATSLALTPVQPASAGNYVVKVNGAGACSTEQVVSSGAVLSVNTPVSITTQPNAVTVCEGTSATFSVQATGTITGYQWYRNGTAITGATTNSYQLTTGTTNNGDKYKVDVQGPCGNLTSSEVTLGVQAKPAITLQPTGATKCVGDNYTFTATATNAGSYQWQHNGTDISGATGSSLVLTNLCSTCDAGSYRVRVDGAGACPAEQVVSNQATLMVNDPVSIITQPNAQTVCEGTSATFSVVATGTISGYQWYKNGAAITGATSATYQLTTNAANNSDKYKVAVAGPCGTVISSEATLGVLAKPVITLQPTGATKCVGESYTFSVMASSTGAYQWQKDGVDLAGATSASLILSSIQPASAGRYRVRVGGTAACSGEQILSSEVTLAVNDPISINTQPIPVSVCEGVTARYSVVVTGTITGYQWYRNGTAISGATNSSYELGTALNNNADKYKVDVQGPCGTVTSTEVTLTVNARPTITAQPSGATKCVGEAHIFNVITSNAGSFQWQKDGTDLSGATGSSLVLTNLCSTCDAGSYRVVVNGAGACSAQQVVSNPATLIVNDPAGVTTQPVAQTVCEAASVSFAVSATGTITGYQWYRNGTAINGATSATYQLTTGIANNGDKYKIDVQGPCGTITSSEVTLSVNAKPVITMQPLGATKCVGDNYSFTVTGTTIGSYQWQKDGVDLAGATSATLVLNTLSVSSAGKYRVRVTGAATCNGESLISNGAVLVVNTPVTISAQPQATAVCEGSNATFTVQAGGTITGYQWYRNGTVISGVTSASYQLTTSTANNGDKYKVDVQGPCGNVTSIEVTLGVTAKPVITLQPTGATKCVGEEYTFSVTATNAGSYQWQKDGAEISGATAASLVLTNLCSTCDAGAYRVVVSGAGACSAQQVVSSGATLMVNDPVGVTTQPVAQTVCEATSVSFAVSATGTITGYQWYRNGVVISGASSATYQFTTNATNNADKYRVAVAGPCGTVTSSEVTLGVQAKPAITLQPVGATKCVGDNYTFTATATSAGSYQWQKDGADISGAMLATLTLTPIQPASAGSYVVKVSGTGSCAAQSVVSNGAVLVVNTPVSISTQPIAVSVCEGTSATFSVVATGTITGYQWYRNGTAITGATTNSYQLTTITTNNNDKYKVEVAGPCGNLTSTEAGLTVNAKPVITLQPVGATKCVGESYTFSMTASNAGVYQWQKDGVDLAGATSATLVLNTLSLSSAGTYRVRVGGTATCSGEQILSSEVTLVVNNPVTISTQPIAVSVCEGASATFSVVAAGTITGYQWYRNGVTIGGATSATYQLTTSTANNADKYKVAVAGPCGTVTSNEVTLGVQAKPAITLQPTGATKCVGETYTFTATATNAGAYQWQKEGVDIIGATSANLVLTSLQTTGAGTYRVRVTGAATCNGESLVSNGAVLAVNTPVTINSQPTATAVCEGSAAVFSVQAAGSITGYQWSRNGTAITGATSATYQLTTSTANNGDKYKVDVQGPCGTLTSSEVTLTVNAKPMITLQPVGATKCVGESYTFSVTATNAGAYQWQKDGADITGATAATLVLATLQPASAGSYQVRVTGLASCAAEQFLSNIATLSVNQPIVITTQPAVQQVCEGSAATLTVQATGTITGYQWYRNGVAINGAISSSYQLVTSTTNNNEQYKVDVQGPCATVTSINVSLTVNAKPVFTAQPVGSAKCVGEGYTFTVTASGTITSYQWQRNGINIAGATAATYTLAAIQPGDAGTYQVVLTGPAACQGERLVSAGAGLVVNVPIVITTPLVSQTICEGNPVTFAPTATGTITGYRWYRNGQLLSTTDPTYTLTATLTNQNDKYRVELTGPCGMVTSAEATLTVIRTETPTITTNKPDGMCVGEQTTLTASGCTGTVTWFLNSNTVGAGTTLATGQAGAYTASCANQGCAVQPRSNAIQIIQLSPVAATAVVQNVTCFAGGNGSVAITPGGAAGAPYSVRWTNPASFTGPTIANLPAGTYAYTITDRAGCTLSGTQSVTQPAQPSGSIVATDVTCNGQKDGRLVLTARSDYGGYTYSVNGGTPITFSAGATQTLTNLDQGTYTVRITDARNCEVLATTPVTINQPSVLAVLAGLAKQPLSADSKDGSVELSASGGTGPYTVRWYDASGTQLTTQVQTTITATGVISRLSSVDGGVYRVVFTDKNGCEQAQTQTLVAPPRLVTAITTVPISCFGRNDGTATVAVTGGVAFTTQPAYRIGWRRQGTTMTVGEGLTITGLAPGTYEATITDANGISTTATVPLTEPTLLKTTVGQVLPNYCTNLPLGEVTLQTEGGRAPYRITWNGNAVTGNTITKLPGGRQIFTVTDASGCVATTEAVVPDNATAFSTSIAYTAPTCFGRCDGTLISTVQGGNAPYQYNWRNLLVTTPTALSVCGTGETALTIQDAKGCVITSAVVSLTAPAPRVLGLPTTQEVCPSKPFELSAASLTWGKTFTWTLPNSTTQTGATIQASGVGTYQVTVLDENSCGGQGTILVRQFSAVKQLFTMPSEAVAGKSVVAVDLTSPNPTTIRWELPGGTIVSQDTYQAKLSFAKIGTFSVTEIATVDNCDYRLTKAIDIKASLDDNGFPRPMNVAPIEVTVMSNPTVGTTLQLAIANPADEDFSVTVQPITGHQRVFSQEYSKHGSNPLTVSLPSTVPVGLYVLTVQTATVRITKHILVSR